LDTEIPSPASGILTRIVVGEDETAEVGSELAVIDGDGDAAAVADARRRAPVATAPAAEAPVAEAPAAVAPAAVGLPRKLRRTEAPAAESSAAEAPAAAAPAASGGATTVVKMPALGESVTEGTVTRWLKQVGRSVEADEALLEVSTDKVDTEIPSPAAGTVLEIKVAEDETVAVGADLAVIGTSGAAPVATPVRPDPRSGRPGPGSGRRRPGSGSGSTPAPAPAPAATLAPTSARSPPLLPL